jgi:hypothetical protein
MSTAGEAKPSRGPMGAATCALEEGDSPALQACRTASGDPVTTAATEAP